MVLDPLWLKDLSTIAMALAAAFLAALWLSLIFWTLRDIRHRTRDPLLRILAVLVTTVLFIPGILIYLILRPNTTLEEEYQTLLEEESLLQTIEEPVRCPGCGRVTQPDWMICPGCHIRLKKVCHHCKKLMELPWDLCPYCGTLAPGARREDVTGEEVVSRLPLNSQPGVKAPLDQPPARDVEEKSQEPITEQGQ